ncbi:MAG: pseudouridine synthase [Burkholderiales bacterium]|nr:pseudouridine synthase [Burkholderiales bacterium]
MRVKLTAKHPRPASPSRAPVRTGSPSARKTPRTWEGAHPAASGNEAKTGARDKATAPASAAPKRSSGAKPRDGAPAKRATAAPKAVSHAGQESVRRSSPRPAQAHDAQSPSGEKARTPRDTDRPRSAGKLGDAPGARNRGSAERDPRTERTNRPGRGAAEKADRNSRNTTERGDRPARRAADRGDRPARSATERSGREPDSRKIANSVKYNGASSSGPTARSEEGRAGGRPRQSAKAPAGDRKRPASSETHGRAFTGKRQDEAKRATTAKRSAASVKGAAGESGAPRTEHTEGLVRLSKRMSELGLCSRREADEWIENGWVRVDGARIDTLGARVRPDQHIEVTRDAHVAQSRQVTILLHKPVGYVSGQAEDGYEPAITLITAANRWEGDRATTRFAPSHLRALAPAGRLDIDSTGLLVLTQDGRIAKQLIGEHSSVEKEYLVRVTYGDRTTDIDQHFPADKLALLRFGLSLDDAALKPAKVSWQNGEQLRFVLREGKKRQIRRMCELVGLHVVGLKRVRMGRIALGALPQGNWRYLLPDEAF